MERLRCKHCGRRPPKTPKHVRCWQCLHGSEPPPCKGCGGPQWMSGWCRACHPALRPAVSLPRSCITCLAWGLLDAPDCKACRNFRRNHSIDGCLACSRILPVSGGYCRLCRLQGQYLHDGNQARRAPYERVRDTGQQLFLADTHRAIWRQKQPSLPVPATPTSVPGHGELGLRRRPWLVQGELFVLAPHALATRVCADDPPRRAWLDYLSAAAGRLAEESGWSNHVRHGVARTLETLVAAHEPGRPYRASEVTAVRIRHGNATRVMQVLASLNLLDDDRPDADAEWLGRHLDGLPPGIQTEISRWADALRHGDTRTKAKSTLTWRHYVTDAVTAVRLLPAGYESLREVTRQDITTALARPRGGDGHTLVTALRSLFGFLKKNRWIFANPTSRLSRSLTRRPDDPIPQRLEPSTLDELTTAHGSATAWLIIVLAAHHALTANPIRHIRLEQVDLAERWMRIGEQTRPLDDLTFAAITGYMTYRQARWPRTANRHMLVNQQTAHHDSPASRWWVREAARLRTTHLAGLRRDRILEEVMVHGVRDPLHIAAMFGLHPDTAQRYTDAIYGRPDTNP